METDNSLNPADRLVGGLGGRAAVAERFGVSSEAVRLWLKNGIPADRALDVEEATSGTQFAITATEVLEYGRAKKTAAQEAAGAASIEERAA